MTAGPVGTAGRLLRALTTSGARRLAARQRLRKRHAFAALGNDFDYEISENSRFGRSCRLGGPVFVAGSTIGDFTYIELGSRISAADVGKFCSIAPYAMIGLAEHPVGRFVSTHPLFYRRMPRLGYDLVDRDHHTEVSRTRVGNDVWVGAGACVRSGLEIGDGAVVGAGAVVTRDVPPYAVVAGVPARLVRYRFDEETIRFLLEFKWWDRDLDWLREHVADMHDVARMTGRHGGARQPQRAKE